MDETASSQAKSTPARQGHAQRQHRTRKRPPGPYKTYASENDVSALTLSRADRAPQTPSKHGSASGVYAESNSFTAAAASKSNKSFQSRAKNNSISPDSALRPRQVTAPSAVATTPHRAMPNRSGSASTAFAGATFHASPAPSALPLPSFFSKSTSNTPVHEGARGLVQEPSPPPTDTDAPTPLRPSSAPKTHESPLDFMFRAHRAEKEQQFRTSPTKTAVGSSGKSTASPRPNAFGLSTRDSSSVPVSNGNFRQLYDGVDGSKLDRRPSLTVGPAFSTPYHERIRAAVSNSGRGTALQFQADEEYQDEECPDEERQTADPAEALKRFLLNQSPISNKANAQERSLSYAPAAPIVSSSTVREAAEPGNVEDIRAMENSLRRILKLDVLSESPSSDPHAFPR
ncbi:hypothetical protein CDD81_2781 [Ophiocordyceps australis]|uniref:Proteophosphoglycan 5 n=1 Tax=Ophiocordyceps australis TaxID=1399860 RepID=A0A2C5XEH2_9HYPO|nr:hypothetical protein CDD81_2781 [Ophiocordyceps australis]